MANDTKHTRRDSSTDFLTVAEAAVLLGLSRLRVRQAAAVGALTSRRDNEGMLRVDVPKTTVSRNSLEEKMQANLPPAKLLEVLFDEVEETHAVLGLKDQQLAECADVLVF